MMRVDPLTGEVEDVPARHITGIFRWYPRYHLSRRR